MNALQYLVVYLAAWVLYLPLGFVQHRASGVDFVMAYSAGACIIAALAGWVTLFARRKSPAERRLFPALIYTFVIGGAWELLAIAGR